VVNVHGYHAISESTHRILNPFNIEKLDLLGDMMSLSPGDSMLDLASGKGEMLCRYAARYGITGTGVDIYEPLVAEAQARAVELKVDQRVDFVVAEAAEYARSAEVHDVVACIGATWVGGGLAGTLALMRPLVGPGGWALVGECYRMPSGPTGGPDDVPDLVGVLDCVEASGFEMVEMVLANQDDWDRYSTSQWLNVAGWLDDHPDHLDSEAIRAWRDASRRAYLSHDRDHLGWGVFILRPRS
jgi:hypothetical protein